MARTLGAAVPRDRRPPVAAQDVRGVSALTRRLQEGDTGPGRGGAWLDWARALSAPQAIGLPEDLACELLDALVGELNRAVGAAYPRRYEALSLMRGGPYGHLVVEVARGRVADPAVQVLNDMMSAVAEVLDDQVLGWAFELLADEREHVAEAGAVALENLSLVGGRTGFWAQVAPRLVTLLNDLEVGGSARGLASHLLRLAPPSVGRRAANRLDAPLAPAGPVEAGRPGITDQLRARCDRLAEQCAAEAGLPATQPVLASMIFDIALSPLEARGVAAYMLLTALPAVTTPLAQGLALLAESVDDPIVRRRTARRLAGSRWGTMPPAAQGWLRGPDESLRHCALVLAGHGGWVLPADVGRGLVEVGGEGARRTVIALAMAGSDQVQAVAADGTLPPSTRDAARWWLGQGSRVSETV